jgi:phosphoserine aminotransferase
MSRIHNYYAGPAAIPLEALEKAQAQFTDYEGCGMSVMELSHRSKTYDDIHNNAIALVREVYQVPENYQILLLQGGASTQFAMVPYNLLGEGQTADYIVTGAWSKKAVKEAKTLGSVNIAADTSEDGKFFRVPAQADLKLTPGARYVHMTSNNTIFGTQFHSLPDTGDVPLVIDMSSDILYSPMDWSKNIGIIYAGAQKNLGPSGVTLVIIRDDLLESCRDDGLTMLKYKTHSEKNSMFNTCPTFAIYMLGLCMQWVKDNGAAAGMRERNQKKVQELYGTLEGNPSFFTLRVEKDSRSWMNVTFNLPTPELEAEFVKVAEEKGFVGVKGHRSVKGIRVSMYNATSPESIEAFTGFLKEFAAANA